MVSRSGEYALRAVLYLASRKGDGPFRADEVAAALDLPRNYLHKILHALKKAGILDSARGPSGGFMLAVPAAELTLHAIVSPFADLPAQRRCILGRGECNDADPCSAHHHWKAVADGIAFFFRETTVAALVGGGRGEDGGVVGVVGAGAPAAGPAAGGGGGGVQGGAEPAAVAARKRRAVPAG
jgi:Rrf2 family transcriptional regulator, iron-sulfur cluster assembly transcription factor